MPDEMLDIPMHAVNGHQYAAQKSTNGDHQIACKCGWEGHAPTGEVCRNMFLEHLKNPKRDQARG
jgi:hypothetical protein